MINFVGEESLIEQRKQAERIALKLAEKPKIADVPIALNPLTATEKVADGNVDRNKLETSPKPLTKR